jgi:ATP-dependent Clp protease ATP-binding subunit ClpC
VCSDTDASNNFKFRAKKPTPTLDQFAIDLTQKAAKGQLNDIIGREDEINLIVECLCRRSKRCPVLVGPAGIGKTAIIEGFALKIVRGEVPDPLKNVRVLALQPSVLLAGVYKDELLDQRIEAILEEASCEGLILFIDEAQRVFSSSGGLWSKDVASRFNPALVRGEINCIAAVTDEKYSNFADRSIERYFQPIRVGEVSHEKTITILSNLGKNIEQHQKIKIAAEIYPWLVDFANRFIRNRYFPDKGIDLLEQCVSYVIANGRKRVRLKDAMHVAERLVGYPFDLSDKLGNLNSQLSDFSLLKDEEIEVILNRLNVTMRGLDIHPARPNLVFMLIDKSAVMSEILAGLFAESLFGDRGRIIVIDSTLMTRKEDIAWLLGYEPEFEKLHTVSPLYKITQTPWCVVSFENLDECHPMFIETLRQAVEQGFFIDADGRRIFLSDSVVLISVSTGAEEKSQLGFQLAGEQDKTTYPKEIEDAFGKRFLEQVDLISLATPDTLKDRKGWLEGHLLKKLTERYAEENLNLSWDQSFIAWLLKRQEGMLLPKELEKIAEEQISPLLIQYLPEKPQAIPSSLLVAYEEKRIQVRPRETQEGLSEEL